MNVLDTAIYSRLQSTSALTSLLAGTTALYNRQAPEGQVLPYVVWSIQGGGDMHETPRRRKNLLLYVRAYTTGSNGAAQGGSIDAQIDTALHLNPLTVSGWTNIWLAREQDLEIVENPPTGGQVFMNGGIYRCFLDST